MLHLIGYIVKYTMQVFIWIYIIREEKDIAHEGFASFNIGQCCDKIKTKNWP